jgi:hypothetical protein
MFAIFDSTEFANSIPPFLIRYLEMLILGPDKPRYQAEMGPR